MKRLIAFTPSRLARFAPLLIAGTLLSSNAARALPVGFGRNQNGIDYDEINDGLLYIYHDARTPHEGAMALDSLEAARPILEGWFDVKRSRPLPVVMSAVTDNASFANFITDAIELQTDGQGDRDLFLHEFVHNNMYLHFVNWLGPSGSAIHLPFMPAWWIEGLAEALSVSVGSDVQAGIERYQALSGDWPSYARLHSLYGQYDFFLRGYATSGALVAYALRTGHADRLASMHETFFRYSMPWWWPWAAVPFNGFMPMDKALEDLSGDPHETGESLYEKYKQDATAYWKQHANGPFLVGRPGARASLTNLAGVKMQGNTQHQVLSINGALHDVALTFDPKTGWATNWTVEDALPPHAASYARLLNSDTKAFVTSSVDLRGNQHASIQITLGKHETMIPRGEANVSELYDFGDEIGWLEQRFEVTRFCHVAKTQLEQTKTQQKVACPLSATLPRTLESLGQDQDEAGHTREIWLSETAQTLLGNRYRYFVWRRPSGSALHLERWRQAPAQAGVHPLGMAFAGDQRWLLSGERTVHSLRRVDEQGHCLAASFVADHVLTIGGDREGGLWLGLFAGNGRNVIHLGRNTLKEEACPKAQDHISPLIYALRHLEILQEPDKGITAAVRGASIWSGSTPNDGGVVAKAHLLGQATLADANRPAAKPGENNDNSGTQKASAGTASENASEAGHGPIKAGPAQWRPRPVLGVPWIGADALGPQFGVVSLPLMDHMQDETLRVTFLYGTNSHFPDTELQFTSTRWWPQLEVDAFRTQSLVAGRSSFLYVDERGARFDVNLPLSLSEDSQLSIGGGSKVSEIYPFLPAALFGGPLWLAEPYVDAVLSQQYGQTTWENAAVAHVAPKGLNKRFNYNEIGFSSTVSRPLPFWASRFELGLEGSRVRGAKKLSLEYYMPLKTFVPGSGGGYNKNSYGLLGSDTGTLFVARLGDTQGRAKVSWTVPLVADFDTLVWIFYLERLDFTAFLNYGGAWSGHALPKPKELLVSHGYNFDLQWDLKGIHFNLGLGVGQVLRSNYQMYVTTGFDNLF